MNNNLVSMNNLQSILEPIGKNIVSKINNKDISQQQKDILDKTSIIDDTTNNGSILSNNGKYNNIGLNNINDSIDKTNNVYDLFKIKEISKLTCNSNNHMNISRDYATSCIYNDNIYVMGNSGNNNKLEIYNINLNTCIYGADVPNPAGWMVATICDKKIYCIGGKISNLNRIYDIETNTWTIGKPMINPRYAFASEIYNKNIYCISGHNGSDVLSNIEIYDIDTNIWTIGYNIPFPRFGLDSIIYDNKIYCIGGANSSVTNKVEIYDIKTNLWSISKNMPIARRGLQCELYKDEIYCINGISDRLINNIDIYNITNDHWNTIDSIIPPKYAFTSEIYKNKIYCIDGFNGTTVLNNIDILSLSYMDYDINLPSIIQTKLDIFKSDGLGNKILSDTGEYIDIPKGYRFMESNEITEFINNIKLSLDS